MSNREILILGAGVSGLTCAVALAERGYAVRVLTAAMPLQTTSAVAGGLWMPYKIEPKDRVIEWSRVTVERLIELSRDAECGVIETESWQLFRRPPESDELFWLRALPVDRWRRLDGGGIPAGYVDGYSLRVFVMDVPVYLPWLARRVEMLGGTIELLPSPVESLDLLFSRCNVIVNCAGLSAGRLCDDREVFPIRGQVVKVENTSIRRAICDEQDEAELTYTIPRSRDVVLGGTTEPGQVDTTPDSAVSRRLIDRNARLQPALAQARVLREEVGLRPGRSAVRLQREDRAGGTIIHNYGHGGAGYTVSWGCAADVAAIVQACAQ